MLGRVALWSLVIVANLTTFAIDVSISGPGYETPQLVLPARYFFLQPIDKNGRALNFSHRDVNLEIVDAPAGCHVFGSVHNAKDGSYNVRLVPESSCPSLKVRFKFADNGQSLGKEMVLDGPIEADDCSCPMPAKEWMQLARCQQSNFTSLIDQRLAAWLPSSIDFKLVAKIVAKKWTWMKSSVALVHYKVRSNTIYKVTYGTHTGFSEFMDSTLLSITRKVQMPDMDFFMNLGDWPLEIVSQASDPPIPLFSWCASNDTYDIVLPTYEAMLSIEKYNLLYNEDLLSVNRLREVPWANKVDKAFWRGRDSREERLTLVNISKGHPDLLDAAITHFFFFTNVEHLYYPIADVIPFSDFFKYKYQVNVDGTVAAYRLTMLMAGNSVVLKQESKYAEHYYALLEPWKHYVPVKSDLSDLLAKIRWAKKNEAQVLRIIEDAHQFLKANLLPREVFCYHVMAFTKYADLLKRPLYDGDLHLFEKVEQKRPRHLRRCNCAKAKSEL